MSQARRTPSRMATKRSFSSTIEYCGCETRCCQSCVLTSVSLRCVLLVAAFTMSYPGAQALPPHPSPLPQGRGNLNPSSLLKRREFKSLLSPLQGGEDEGEGVSSSVLERMGFQQSSIVPLLPRVPPIRRFACVDQHKSDPAVFRAAVNPGVVGPLLHHDVAGLEMDLGIIEQHVDFAAHHDRVVDAPRSVPEGMPRRRAGGSPPPLPPR